MKFREYMALAAERAIDEALQRNNHNRLATAKELKISLSTLAKYIDKFRRGGNSGNSEPRRRPREFRNEEFLRMRSVVVGECKEWDGATNGYGYGIISRGGKRFVAHRISWEVNKGPIPDGMHIHHMCRNKKCIKIEHLTLLDGRVHSRMHNDKYLSELRAKRLKESS